MFCDSISLCNLIYSKKAGSHLLVSSLYTRGKGCSCESLRRNLHLSMHICIGAIRKKVLVAQSCLTLCHPMDCSSPGSFVPGILQARILEWLPFPSPVDLPNTRISCIVDRFFTIWTTKEAPIRKKRSNKNESYQEYMILVSKIKIR